MRRDGASTANFEPATSPAGSEPATGESRCFSCGAATPQSEGPVHRYMDSSPGCWAAFGEVLAREFSDVTYASRHRLTVDAYAVQHPGRPCRQSIQSVTLHLVSLCLVFESGKVPHEASSAMQRLSRHKADFEWLEPPGDLGGLTVVDVLGTEGPTAHTRMVDAWALAAWQAWADHHPRIRVWIDRIGA